LDLIDERDELDLIDERDERGDIKDLEADDPVALSLRLSLIGRFQVENARCASLALLLLGSRGWPVDRASIEAGLANARWPGRFECFAERPEGPTLVVDGAHNPPAASALVESLDWRFGAAKRHWILGFSSDKDLSAILDAFQLTGSSQLKGSSAPETTILTVAADHPRALSAQAAQRLLAEAGIVAEAAGRPAEALALAMQRAEPGEIVVATGSIFVAADARMAWFRRLGLPLPESDPPAP
jgi:dihydrofolate synthase/folylpolyglutamate synthase